MFLGQIKARDTIERLAAAANPYSVTRSALMDAVQAIPREELAKRFEGDKLLANFVLNHWEYAHGSHTLLTYPWNVVIPISDVCNARCTFCNSWLRGKRLLDLADLERFASVLRTAAMISLEGHGEPLVHPKFREIVQTLRKIVDRRCRFSIITNGLLLDENLDELLDLGVNVFNVSLNAATQRTHDEVMGLGAGAWERVTGVLRELIRRGRAMEASNRPTVNLSLVVTAMNIQEIPAFVALAEEMGASQVNLRTLLPQTELLAGLNYHVLPPYLAKDFDKHVAAASAAVAAARVTVEADVASWSKPVFPPEVQKRIDANPPQMLSRREGQRVVMMQKEDFKGLERMTSKGEALAPGKGDPRWTIMEELAPEASQRRAPFKCSDVYTTLHMNDFFFVLRPCCYMDAVPNHDVIKYDGSYDFFEAWNSAAMVSLRKRLHEGPLYSMCRRCPQQLQYPAPEARGGDYESVPAGLGSWETDPSWDAQVLERGSEGTTIVTPKEQWAYAAFRPLREPAAGIGGRLVVDLRVEEGAVSVGLLDARKEKFLAEATQDAGSAPKPISFDLADLSTATGLIFRNTSAGGKRSRALVRSVEMQQRQGVRELIGYRVNRDAMTLNDMEPTEDVASATWLESSTDYQSVAGAAGRWVAETAFDAQVIDRAAEGVSIATPQQQWAYAATLPLRASAEGERGRIIVDMQVEDGAIGVSMRDKRKEHVVSEVIRNAGSPAGPVIFRVGDLSQATGLIVRNTAPGGKRSRALIRSVDVQRQFLGKFADDHLVNPGSFHLNDVEPARDAGAGTRAVRGLRLVGKPIEWAFLAIARFSSSVAGLTGPAVFRVRLHVHQGQVVIGLLNQAESDFISQTFWGPTAEPLDVVLHCDAVEGVSALLVRASNMLDPIPVLTISGLEVALPAAPTLH